MIQTKRYMKVSKETVVLRWWDVLQDNMILSNGLIKFFKADVSSVSPSSELKGCDEERIYTDLQQNRKILVEEKIKLTTAHRNVGFLTG